SYCTGLVANRVAASPFTLNSTLSRMLLMTVPYSFRISPIKSMTVWPAPAFCARTSSSPAIYGQRDKVFGLIQLEMVQLHCDREFGDRIVRQEGFFKLPFFVCNLPNSLSA
ncbi:MAG TPA: hypothetical protein VGQ28_04785, partial [Thermoanaerobaculia bacterium]|nr:hypothetical protein [Thermoanaerobaculia bacterium]